MELLSTEFLSALAAIVVWGSTMLLRVVDRFPGFVYLGAGVLALTAAKMISAEPFLKDLLSAYTLTVPALYAVIVVSVLWVASSRTIACWRRESARDWPTLRESAGLTPRLRTISKENTLC